MSSLIKPSTATPAAAIIVCVLLGCFLLSLQNSPHRPVPNPTLIDRSVGDNVSAIDIYGLGVRIGFYLQSLGISITTFRQFRNLVRAKVYDDEVDERDEPHSDTPVLAFAIVTIAVLINLTTQIANRNISPAEVIVVLNILSTNTLVNLGLLSLGVGDFRGNGIGYLLNLCCSAWVPILLMWIWIKGRTVLPLLGTSNHTWFFAKVRIDGWFWIYSTVQISITAIFLIIVLLVGVVFVGTATKWWWQHRAESDIWEEDEVPYQRGLSFGMGVLGTVALPIFIATAEMTIKYNGLQPENDLSSPSQLIPFAAGIANSIDSLLYLVRPYKKRRPEPAAAPNLTPKSSSLPSSSSAREDLERQDHATGSIHMSDMRPRDPADPMAGPSTAPTNFVATSFAGPSGAPANAAGVGGDGHKAIDA